MKKLALALAFALWPGFAFGQCTGVFPPNTVCGNLTGSPQPPAAFTTAGLIIGPVSSTLNGLPLWANTAGTQLKDGAGQTIAGNYTWSGTQTYSAATTFNALANFTSTFQIAGNTMTFPGVATALASSGAGNTWSGPQAGTFNITGSLQLSPITAHAVLLGEAASPVVATGPGTAGQALISNGASADPTFQTPAVIQATTGNPTATSSASLVMMGLGTTCKITPATSGRIKFVIFTVTANSGANTNTTSFRYGTGTAPANAAAATGTAPGSNKTAAIPVAAGTATATYDYIVTGLIPGTAYWFDLALSTSAGSASVSSIDCNAMEF